MVLSAVITINTIGGYIYFRNTIFYLCHVSCLLSILGTKKTTSILRAQRMVLFVGVGWLADKCSSDLRGKEEEKSMTEIKIRKNGKTINWEFK